jgi:hypothetical protein
LIQNLCVLEVPGLLLGNEHFDIFAPCALIAFEREHVIGIFVLGFLGNIALAAHGIDGDDSALDGHHIEERRDGDDFVGLFRHLDLPKHKPLARSKRRDHMDWGFRAFLLVGSAHRLAINHIR